MYVHRLNGRVGVAIAASVAIAAAVVMVKRHAVTYPLGVKGDRLEIVVPQAECSPAIWPYGCEWIDTSHDPRKQLKRADPKRQNRHGLRRLLS